MMADEFNLQRFVDAQDFVGSSGRSVFDEAYSELLEGQKRTHWMWFIFPQLRGLGTSETSRFFAISSREEARAYLVHPVLGARLRQSTRAVLLVKGRTGEDVFGRMDETKFRSSMTLFANVSPSEDVFCAALDMYFGGEEDSATLALL